MSAHTNAPALKAASDRDGGASAPKWLNVLVMVTAMFMILYHLGSIWFPVLGPILHQNIHLGFAFIMVFLAACQQSQGRRRSLFLVGALLSLVVTIYVHVHFERLDMWSGFPENMDVVVGLALVSLIVLLTWKIWGGVFPILLGISILYALFGHKIPGALGHALIGPKLVLSNLGIGLKGAYGMMLNASANLIFMFIIFGSVFEAVGIDKLFLEIGYFLGGRFRGGSGPDSRFFKLPGRDVHGRGRGQRRPDRFLHHPLDEKDGLPPQIRRGH